MKALLTEKNHQIDAFLCCGNMAAISGYDIYKPIMDEFNVPCLPTGFEPMQLIEGIAEICRQLIEGKASQCYDFAVSLTAEGNKIAQKYTADYFAVVDDYWRGLGKIEKSALSLKDKYGKFDAHKRFGIERAIAEDISGCRCGEVICGLIEPRQCGMYGKECTRQNPLGPCMASSEGACRTWQKYSRK
jgi:hydrogenase expression/formation protein HypD